MKKTPLSTPFWALVLSFVAYGAYGQTQAELERILQQADARRKAYVDTFKDLTAVETKVTELIDKDGKTSSQREVVSDFLVYQSGFRSDAVAEYRITREVDGKAVGKNKSAEDAIKLLQSLARAKTLGQEYQRLREENLKHTLHYYRWGMTLEQVPQLRKDRQPDFKFEIAGRETIGGRESIVLRYEQRELRPAESRGILDKFKKPRTGFRGRVWLDVEDGGVRKWENDLVVSDGEIATPAILLRDEIAYEPSPFGIWVPEKVVSSFFDKSEAKTLPRTLRLAGRVTVTYEDYRRFLVETDYKIHPPQ